MIYRGTGFLAAPRPPPSPYSPVCLPVGRRREGGGGGRGAESCDRKKAWPSINRSILFALDTTAHVLFVLTYLIYEDIF
jgi:hypothetical protein